MSDDFIDSNVFVYLFDEVDGRKRGISEYLVTDALDSGSGVISYQVIQETLNVITRKLPAPATREDADHFMRQVLEPMWSVAPSIPLYHRALDIQARYSYGFYDALIIAAALHAGSTRLFTEDLQHGQRIEGLTIEDPFRESSEAAASQ